MLNVDVVEHIDDGIVLLRKITKQDAPFLFKSLKEREVNEYLSLGPLVSLVHSRRLIDNYLKYWEEYSQFTYIIELKNAKKETRKIGSTSLWNLNWNHRRAEIGIWLIPSHFNQGIGTRVVELVKIIGLVHYSLHRLEAHAAVANENSARLFSKTGFEKECVLKDYINLHGVFHDVSLFTFIGSKIKK